MSLIELLFGRKQKTATVARDRLQIIIAQERAQEGQTPDYLPTLRKALMEVLSKYVNVSLDNIRISQEKQDGMDVLELNITLPEQKKVLEHHHHHH
nr:Chain A, Cell division topological specificity factor [Neisseria gonorrhoeae]2KXO_B Chain B, Cell division topological specificity factor [Neisseria gonorrhoeae]